MPPFGGKTKNKVLKEPLLLWKIALSHKHPKQNEKTWTRRTYALGVSLYPFLRGKDRKMYS